jgi:pimeloyl-ACP methyl ester carboxylesterase
MTDTFVDAGGSRIRYLSVGSGPQLVLLHTLRTQLDMFQKVIPALAERHRVLALDYPGHGHSDAPDARYDAEFFVASVAEALVKLEVRDAVIVGESIGATIGLLLAAGRNPRVRAVVAINPYDYDRGRGIRRSSLLANVVFGLAPVPALGEIVLRMGSYGIVRRIFYGGVHRRASMPDVLVRELYESGNREGHARAVARLMRESASWERARSQYANVGVPVLLVYGDHDWSRQNERDADARVIPGARLHIIAQAGHFLSLDAPADVVRLVLSATTEKLPGDQF